MTCTFLPLRLAKIVFRTGWCIYVAVLHHIHQNSLRLTCKFSPLRLAKLLSWTSLLSLNSFHSIQNIPQSLYSIAVLSLFSRLHRKATITSYITLGTSYTQSIVSNLVRELILVLLSLPIPSTPSMQAPSHPQSFWWIHFHLVWALTHAVTLL